MKRRYIYIIATLILAIGLLGSSFGYLKKIVEGSTNQITLSSFDVQLNDITNLTINNAYPMSDIEGLKNQSRTFSIYNNGTISAGYRISLVDGQTHSTISNSDIRYQLKRTIGTGEQATLGIFNLSNDGLLDEGTILAGQTINYEIIMWIDYSSNPNGLSFSKYVSVEGMQVSSLDKSGANFPELADNMIPVYYEENDNNQTEGVWKKADVKNLNLEYKWFDYNIGMWANAVTVKQTGIHDRDYYLDADVGTIIEMDDITSMWVWIPRYKYEIFNGNNEIASEQTIKIIFEHGKDTSGTYTGTGTITNNVSTYTHPAFTFGDEELTGFWMAKFEASTDDTACLENMDTTNCNKTGLNIIIKPDQYSLRYESVSNMFANTRRMESYGNIHGFSQSESATTFLNTSNNLTGDINNDSNVIDTHLVKNLEWGAVAYLSHSKYGKNGNLYVNNNSSYKTGYSAGSDGAGYQYNLVGNGDGASTTGTVYGVYDMSGGASEYAMGNMVDSNGNFQVSKAGTWTSSIYPLAKYYDSYKYGTDSSGTSALSRGILGDATKEVVKNLSSTTGKWYSDFNYFMAGNASWSLRGGNATDGTSAGIFASLNSGDGDISETITSRPVLVVFRDMPWQNNS